MTLIFTVRAPLWLQEQTLSKKPGRPVVIKATSVSDSPQLAETEAAVLPLDGLACAGGDGGDA
jgi:hypothetical protein